ncbi:unnamed protein product [Peronospora farinosa]|uniref:Lipoyl-binding domain-containing protein n=1 Tax=Peronospora farinosa TaxID=134698 RepID=A0AAV0SVX0_9STRA|nr:unnamed protein product [Peronospora farinosa]CAI5709274.1 unnamed protein product [Peronospora farinosa]
MMRLATHALAAQTARRAAMVTECARGVMARRPAVLFSTSDAPCNEAAKEIALPSHIKFRMPDLDFREVGSGAAEATLTKWYVQEGVAVKDGTHMCEIDTPDLSFQLESGDEGYIARLLVGEGVNNISPGKPLAIIVPTEADVDQFVKVLKENPHCIEGYVEPACMNRAVEAEVAVTPTENAASSDVLRMLNKLHKEGLFEDEKALKVLKSLARKNDEQLLTTYKASYENGALKKAAFDKAFFVENALELAEEASGTSTKHNAS